MKHALFLVFLVLLCNSCKSQEADTRTLETDLPDTKTTTGELVERIERLENGLASLSDRVFRESRELFQLKTDHLSIVLDVLSLNTYQRVETPTGEFFLVMVGDVTPFVNGYKLKLLIGNLSTGSYQGFTAHLVWGDTDTDVAGWYESLERQDFEVSETLHSGTWNPVELVIAPATESDLEYLEFSMETGIVNLRGR